jgi:hypothetical protein
MLRYAAMLEHAEGNDEAALEYVQDILNQSRTLYRQTRFIVWHLVALAIDTLGVTQLQEMAPQINVTDTTRQQIRRFIDRLLDDSHAVQAWQGERLFGLDPASFSIGGVPDVSLLAPMYRLDGLRVSREVGAVAEAAGQATHPAAVARMTLRRPNDANRPPAHQMAGLIRQVFMPSTSRAVDRHFQMICKRRMTAVLLAMRLYAFDHGGKLPATLEELVPDYLDRVPMDPFAPDGKTIGYQPDASPPTLTAMGIVVKYGAATQPASVPSSQPAGDD